MRHPTILTAAGLTATLASLCGCATGRSSDAGSGSAVSTTRIETPRGTIDLESISDADLPAIAIDAAPAKVWPALVAAYGALGIPLTIADTSARQIGTQGSVFHHTLGGTRLSQWVECGITALGLHNADSYAVRLAILSMLVSTRDGTALLRTYVGGDAGAEGASEAHVRCTTNGRLERRIAALVQARLR